MRKLIRIQATSVLEARKLAELVGVANKFASRIMIQMDGKTVNAKSIMGVMGLGMDVGKQIEAEAIGAAEEEALNTIEEFLTEQ